MQFEYCFQSLQHVETNTYPAFQDLSTTNLLQLQIHWSIFQSTNKIYEEKLYKTKTKHVELNA